MLNLDEMCVGIVKFWVLIVDFHLFDLIERYFNVIHKSGNYAMDFVPLDFQIYPT
jgi:hypothetical protein